MKHYGEKWSKERGVRSLKGRVFLFEMECYRRRAFLLSGWSTFLAERTSAQASRPTSGATKWLMWARERRAVYEVRKEQGTISPMPLWVRRGNCWRFWAEKWRDLPAILREACSFVVECGGSGGGTRRPVGRPLRLSRKVMMAWI